MGVEQAPKNISPLPPSTPTGVRYHDLALFLTPLCLKKTEDIRDKMGLEGEKWD